MKVTNNSFHSTIEFPMINGDQFRLEPQESKEVSALDAQNLTNTYPFVSVAATVEEVVEPLVAAADKLAEPVPFEEPVVVEDVDDTAPAPKKRGRKPKSE